MRTRDSKQTVTIIIPVYNDPDGVSVTIDSLLSQSTIHDYHLSVVDNGSTDRTPEVVRSYDDSRVSLRHETEVQSSYAARNTGLRSTDSNIIAFVDADMTVPDDWLESALRAFQTNGADYMGCNVKFTLPKSTSFAARYDRETGFPVQQYLKHQHFAPTCCLFVRRNVFEDVGLFDDRLVSGGDKEFGNRVYEANYDMRFAKDATMYHPTRNSLSDLAKKDLRVGRGLCQLQRYHPDRYGDPGVPPRPSGVKSPDHDLPWRNRIGFSAFSTFFTCVRGIGYYREYLTGDRRDDLEDGVPRFEE